MSLSSAAVNEPLKPLAEYTAALERAASELAEIAKALAEASGESADARPAPETENDPNYFDDPELSVAAPLSAKARDALKARLHSGELGRFWAGEAPTGTAGARSSFARDREDLWKLLPEKSGPLARLLRPDFDNPDDPLCLIYSCVNDPRAPPSIDVLYALKLLDEGLATAGVTAPGLAGNCQDAAQTSCPCIARWWRRRRTRPWRTRSGATPRRRRAGDASGSSRGCALISKPREPAGDRPESEDTRRRRKVARPTLPNGEHDKKDMTRPARKVSVR